MLSWRIPPLRFEAAQERRFVQAGAPARLRHLMVSGLVALVVWNLFLLSDLTMVPDMFEQALHLRLLLFTPVAAILLIIGLRFKHFALAMPSFVLEGTLMLTGLFAALCLGWVLMQTHSPFGIMYRCGLVPILIYGNLVQRFRFRYAVFFSVGVLLICLANMLATHAHPHPFMVVDIPMGLLVLLITLYTLIMNFRMELEERRRFLRHERAAELRQQLKASQIELDDLSRRDPLTGVPNRRHFDGLISDSWEAHFQSQQALALLLIDVDHFKAYNDRYGHPAGDQCLRLVADVLQRQMPTEGCVARWGGEEFIAVLPHTDGPRAMRLAQALVDAVVALGLRHDSSLTASSVTISVGVAAAIPGQAVSAPDELIARADAALYRAKHEGRHRCMLA
jgi:diguanylate cyclase (GGDEF)-like protein